MKQLKDITASGASMYCREIRYLLDYLKYNISIIEDSQIKLNQHNRSVDLIIESESKQSTTELFDRELDKASVQQTIIFDAFEPLFASWARLSLIFYPIVPRKNKSSVDTWREVRGEKLRELFNISSKSLLANREFRNSWMHFDERLDRAFQENYLGNRQKFCNTKEVKTALENTLRIFDIEAMEFHFKKNDGTNGKVRIKDIKKCLLKIEAGLTDIGNRMNELLPA